MVYERQRLLLTLLESSGNSLGNMDFQKLLFLYVQRCEQEPTYEFVPYRFGCFSFTSHADKRKLIERGLLVDDDHAWVLTEAGRVMAQRRGVQPIKTATFARKTAHLRGQALLLEQYRNYPYYATRSELLSTLPLTPEEKAHIEAARPSRGPAGLLTIGYEGKSLEAYLNILVRAGVNVLCDVRRNPLSRKYGFSKGTLSKACVGVGIRYEHLPELGIASDQRKELKTQADYDSLFAIYTKNDLPKQTSALKTIRGWITVGDRVALTCFEHAPEQCHRHCVADALARMDSKTMLPIHL